MTARLLENCADDLHSDSPSVARRVATSTRDLLGHNPFAQGLGRPVGRWPVVGHRFPAPLKDDKSETAQKYPSQQVPCADLRKTIRRGTRWARRAEGCSIEHTRVLCGYDIAKSGRYPAPVNRQTRSTPEPDILTIEPTMSNARPSTRLTINGVDLLTLQRPAGGGDEPLQFLPPDPAVLLPPDSPALLASTVPSHAMVGICSCGELGCNSLWAQVRRDGRQVVWEPDPHSPRRTLDTTYRFDLIAYLGSVDAAAAAVLACPDRPRRIARELRRQRDSLFGFDLHNPDFYYRLLDVGSGGNDRLLINVAGPAGVRQYFVPIPAELTDDEIIGGLRRFDPGQYRSAGSADWIRPPRPSRAAIPAAEPSVALAISASESTTLRLAFSGRMHEGSADYWDGNWLLTEMNGVVDGFRFDIAAALRSDEIERFRQGVEQLYERGSGQARLTSMEEWIELLITGGGSGRLEVSGFISGDRHRRRNRLHFVFEIDEQTFLPALLAELAAVESRFPVLGSADRPLPSGGR